MSAIQVRGVVTASGRDRLLEAAGSLFSSSGYAEVGVAQIIERAGVQAPTLYHHFRDKEGLFTYWAVSAFQRVGIIIRQSVMNEASAAGGLSRFAEAFVQHVDFDIRQILHDSEGLARGESREEILMSYYEALYEPLCAVLMRGMTSQQLSTEPPNRLADVFLGGLYALRRRSGQPLDLDAPRWWGQHFACGFARQ